jgi:hypothetical protein
MVQSEVDLLLASDKINSFLGDCKLLNSAGFLSTYSTNTRNMIAAAQAHRSSAHVTMPEEKQ